MVGAGRGLARTEVGALPEPTPQEQDSWPTSWWEYTGEGTLRPVLLLGNKMTSHKQASKEVNLNTLNWIHLSPEVFWWLRKDPGACQVSSLWLPRPFIDVSGALGLHRLAPPLEILRAWQAGWRRLSAHDVWGQVPLAKFFLEPPHLML